MKKHGKKQKNKSKFDNGSKITFDSAGDFTPQSITVEQYAWLDKLGKVKGSNIPPTPNDIEASIPVSEFAAYCSALDKNQYLKAFDIRNRKTPSKSFFSSDYNYEGYKWANEILKKSPLPDLSYESVKNTPSKGYFDIINELKEGTWIKEIYDEMRNSNDEFKKLYQGTWIDECTPITKSNLEKLMSIKKPKNKEMKNKLSDKGLEILLSIPKEEIEAEIERRIIGYNFKDEKSYYAFRTIYHSLKKSIDRDFNLKNPANIEKKIFEVDIKNQECSISLKFAKKHNILDELFTPVYKEENELQSGKWYKTNGDITLWFINSINDKGDGNGYGFLFGQWDIITLNYKRFDFKEASKEYVESMLIKEAEKRGLKQGFIANSMDGKETFRIKGKLFFNMKRNTLYCKLSDRYAPIFENGIWIELKKESNYKTELTKALDNIDKVRKALEKLDSAIKKIKSND